MDTENKKQTKKPRKKQSAQNYVAWLLSKQDYSISSIKRKLTDKEYPKEEIESLIDRYTDLGYLDDKRFFRQILRSTSLSKKGLYKAKNKAREKGVSDDIVNEVISEENIDWFDLARQAKISKFGEEIPEDYALKTKQIKYLVNRGFNFDEAKSALEQNSYND